MTHRNDSASARPAARALPVDGDAYALAVLAVRTERWRDAAERLSALLAAAPAPAPASALADARPSAAPDTVPGDPSRAPTARDAARLLAEALYLGGRHDDCLAACDEARRRGWLAADDPHAAALAGWVLLRRGQARPARELALRHLRLAARAFPPVEPAQHARLLHLLGMCEHRLGRPRPARRALRDAAALFRLAGDPGGAAEALNALGTVEKTAVSLVAAAERFEEALRLHAAHAQPGRRAQALLNLAIVRLKTGATDAALPLLAEASTLAAARGAAQTAVRARIALARARLQAGDAAAARDEAAAARADAAAARFAREEALALETLGDAALAMERPDEAAARWDETLAIARAIAPGGDLEAEVVRRQASLLLRRGEFAAAAAALRRAARAASACGERFEEGIALRDLAMAQLALGQWSDAYRTVRAALAMLRDLGATLEAARCLLAAARVREAWGRALAGRGGAAPQGGDRRDPHEAAWSYAIEAFHAFDDLGRAGERAQCETLMDAMRTRDGCPSSRPPRPATPPPAAADRDRPDALASRPGESPFVARAPAMRRLLALADVAAASDEPVLVTGETGTGKELVARIVHARGRRAKGPFVPVNCAAIPETLFEREFFGHAKGSYTGADRDRPGLCEAADGGTLFLDEIGDLPLSVQAKLLRLLQEGSFRRIGETKERRADLRVIAATNADLPALIAQRRFRQDLYYRLQTLELALPPLRERPEDIDPLIALFARRALAGRGAGGGEGTAADPPMPFDGEVMAALRAYPWPGNVRELEAMTRRLALLAAHAGPATAAMLPPAIAAVPTAALAPIRPSSALNLARHLEAAEKGRIEEALALCGGNRTEAARALGISRNALYRKLERMRPGAGTGA